MVTPPPIYTPPIVYTPRTVFLSKRVTLRCARLALAVHTHPIVALAVGVSARAGRRLLGRRVGVRFVVVLRFVARFPC